MDKFRELIVRLGRELLSSGLTTGKSGNISVRDINTGNIYITPSAVDYYDIKADDVPVLNAMGEVIEGLLKPSIESLLHCKIYASKPDINAIIHTHAPTSTAFACTGKSIPLITEEAAYALKSEVLCAEYAHIGTVELADACVNALREGSRACLLRSHGAVCIGVDPEEAFHVCEALEKLADIYALILMTGQVSLPLQ